MCSRVLLVTILTLLVPGTVLVPRTVLGQEDKLSVGAKEASVAKDAAPRRICLVVGAAGEPEYGEEFRKWASRVRSIMSGAAWLVLDGVGDGDSIQAKSGIVAGDAGEQSHRERILRWIGETPEQPGENWLIFLGHGTHEGKVTQLNLLGPDLSSADLAAALRGKPGRWVFVFCNSSSAPFMASIAGPNRVIVTATKSGAEQNFSRFGDYFTQALTDPMSDLDHDHELSILEVFLTASNGVLKYYEDRGLLATEQALLEDTGDGRGTPAVFYRGLRAVKGPVDKASLDGNLAKRVTIDGESMVRLSEDSMAKRETLEEELERLRSQKGDMDLDQYYRELERVFVQLARIKTDEPVKP